MEEGEEKQTNASGELLGSDEGPKEVKAKADSKPDFKYFRRSSTLAGG